MLAATKADMTKQALTARIADELLRDGVADLPLRDLAARLGTSDRMLLYYFGEKSALIEASIAALAVRLDTLLAAFPRQEGRLAPADLLKDMAIMMTRPGMADFRAVWADVLARGGRGEVPFAAIAQRLIQASLTSLQTRLAIDDEAERARMAGTILAVIEGIWLVGMVAPGSTDGAVDMLIERFADRT